jgi:hypothetical protein
LGQTAVTPNAGEHLSEQGWIWLRENLCQAHRYIETRETGLITHEPKGTGRRGAKTARDLV